jgi:hypothetical protein
MVLSEILQVFVNQIVIIHALLHITGLITLVYVPQDTKKIQLEVVFKRANQVISIMPSVFV